MPRKPRIHYPGAVYHVILRGNAGHPVYFEDLDRHRFFLFLQYAVEKFDCRIHAFCLMTNHIHLVVQTGAIPLSRVMQNISQRYTAWINFTQSRTGHVFQGRYKALLIDADSYLLELVRYIHLNPVRAAMTALPDDYPWSSHHAYAGRETIPWLTTEWALSMFGKHVANTLYRYEQFMLDGIGEQRRREFHSGTCEGCILGDDDFAERALTWIGQVQRHAYGREDLISAVCRAYSISADELRAPGKMRLSSEARGVAALLALETPTVSLTALGACLNRDVPLLSRAARRIETLQADDLVLKQRINSLRNELQKTK
jgi:REP element-mobilizing transposase RayT